MIYTCSIHLLMNGVHGAFELVEGSFEDWAFWIDMVDRGFWGYLEMF